MRPRFELRGDKFFERDPRLSEPLVAESCPVWLLYTSSVFAPLVTIALTYLITSYRVCGRKPTPLLRPWWSVVTYLLLNVAFATLVVSVTKVHVGRPRPNFFALCNYKGYADAISSGNLTAYLAHTVPGAIGDRSHCNCSDHTLRRASVSFPSGHAATSFSGLGFIALFLYAAVREVDGIRAAQLRKAVMDKRRAESILIDDGGTSAVAASASSPPSHGSTRNINSHNASGSGGAQHGASMHDSLMARGRGSGGGGGGGAKQVKPIPHAELAALLAPGPIDVLRGLLLRTCLPGLALFGAFMIAESRTRNYFHNFDDIGFGAIIGSTCAILAFLAHQRAVPTDTRLADTVAATPRVTLGLHDSGSSTAEVAAAAVYAVQQKRDQSRRYRGTALHHHGRSVSAVAAPNRSGTVVDVPSFTGDSAALIAAAARRASAAAVSRSADGPSTPLHEASAIASSSEDPHDQAATFPGSRL